MDESVVISVVKKHPVVYDRSRRDFKDQEKRNEAWKQISTTLNVSPEDCMRMWKNIRERYARDLKILRNDPHANASHKLKWELFESLAFLKPHIKGRQRSFNNMHLNGKLDDRLLIGMVKGYPILYDKFNSDFKDSTKKEAAWNTIAEAFSAHVDDCKVVWKNIRERYAKEQKHMQLAPGHTTKWNLFESLSFLHPHIKSKRRINSSLHCSSSWNDENLSVNENDIYKTEEMEQSFEYVLHEEAQELVDSIEIASESPTVSEKIIPASENFKIDHMHEHSYVTVLDNSSQTNGDKSMSDIAFGNYVGLYLAELTDKKKKSRLKLSIMQILHDND